MKEERWGCVSPRGKLSKSRTETNGLWINYYITHFPASHNKISVKTNGDVGERSYDSSAPDRARVSQAILYLTFPTLNPIC